MGNPAFVRQKANTGAMIIQLAPVTGIGALKARSIVAWGNAPGAEQPRIRRAEGPR